VLFPWYISIVINYSIQQSYKRKSPSHISYWVFNREFTLNNPDSHWVYFRMKIFLLKRSNRGKVLATVYLLKRIKQYSRILNDCYKYAVAINTKGNPFPSKPLIMSLMLSQHKLINWLTSELSKQKSLNGAWFYQTTESWTIAAKRKERNKIICSDTTDEGIDFSSEMSSLS
jgi:hypothetical protein